ncbi:unnamed protein product [Calypogeia fissa]
MWLLASNFHFPSALAPAGPQQVFPWAIQLPVSHTKGTSASSNHFLSLSIENCQRFFCILKPARLRGNFEGHGSPTRIASPFAKRDICSAFIQ